MTHGSDSVPCKVKLSSSKRKREDGVHRERHEPKLQRKRREDWKHEVEQEPDLKPHGGQRENGRHREVERSELRSAHRDDGRLLEVKGRKRMQRDYERTRQARKSECKREQRDNGMHWEVPESKSPQEQWENGRRSEAPKLKSQRKHRKNGRRLESEGLNLLPDQHVDCGEDGDGLVILAKRRLNDVQLFVRRISKLTNKLARTKGRYVKVERHLRQANLLLKGKESEASRWGGNLGSGGPSLGGSRGKAIVDDAHEKAKKVAKGNSGGRGNTSKGTEEILKEKSEGAEELPTYKFEDTNRKSRRIDEIQAKDSEDGNERPVEAGNTEGVLAKKSDGTKTPLMINAKHTQERLSKESEHSTRLLEKTCHGAEGTSMNKCDDLNGFPETKSEGAGGQSNKKSERRAEHAKNIMTVSKMAPLDLSGAKSFDCHKEEKPLKSAAKGAGGELQSEALKLDLIKRIKTEDRILPVSFGSTRYYKTVHSKRLRSIVINPTSPDQFATSSLDGFINLWQIDPKSYDITSRFRMSVISEGRPPECITWHPDGNQLFGVYIVDRGLPQVFIMKNDENERELFYMQGKPHIKGLIKWIEFMPWHGSLFATAGSDHMVTLWRESEEQDCGWKSNVLHGDIHTSVVSGVAGTRSKQIVLSVGMDKRLIAFDPAAMGVAFQIDVGAACFAVLPNPVDFNLVMVGTSQPSKQLHLYDIRVKSRQHVLGWEQSKAESSYTMQSWSKNGFCLASGSRDSKINIFDIRYNKSEPAKTITAHDGSVFAAIWHPTIPVLLSISIDRKIGRHNLSNL